MNDNVIKRKYIQDLVLNDQIVTNVDIDKITINVDDELNISSPNTVQNKVVTNNITNIEDNTYNLQNDADDLIQNTLDSDDILSVVNSESQYPVKSSTIYNIFYSELSGKIIALENAHGI